MNIAPEAVTLFPGSPASLSVSLIPSAPKDVAAAVSNRNPDIIETQSSVTVPAGGSASLTVKAIKGGIGAIQIGTSEATVEVIEESVMLSASPVSVLIEAIPGGTVIHGSPVSVFIGNVYIGSILSHSNKDGSGIFPGDGGPGAFAGGFGGTASLPGGKGLGPGGGNPGSVTTNSGLANSSGGGGGGGGAILIASSGTITVSGSITANN